MSQGRGESEAVRVTEDRGGRDPDRTTIENKVTAPSGLHTAVMAGWIRKLVVNSPLHLALWTLLGAVLVLSGVVVMSWVLRDPGVNAVTGNAPTSADSSTHVPTTAEPTTATAEPTTAEPTPEPTPEPTATTTSPRPRPRPTPTPTAVHVLWEGTVKLRGDDGPQSGWYFDHPKPQPAFVGDLGFGDATSVAGDLVVEWPEDGLPDRSQCAGLLHATAGSTRASARVGNVFCFTTRGGRLGHATVIGTSAADPLDPSISLDVVVWDLTR